MKRTLVTMLALLMLLSVFPTQVLAANGEPDDLTQGPQVSDENGADATLNAGGNTSIYIMSTGSQVRVVERYSFEAAIAGGGFDASKLVPIEGVAALLDYTKNGANATLTLKNSDANGYTMLAEYDAAGNVVTTFSPLSTATYGMRATKAGYRDFVQANRTTPVDVQFATGFRSANILGADAAYSGQLYRDGILYIPMEREAIELNLQFRLLTATGDIVPLDELTSYTVMVGGRRLTVTPSPTGEIGAIAGVETGNQLTITGVYKGQTKVDTFTVTGADNGTTRIIVFDEVKATMPILVTDEDTGLPIPTAAVVVKDAATGNVLVQNAVTDADGKVSVEVPAGKAVIITASKTGYVTKDTPVTATQVDSGNTVEVKLKSTNPDVIVPPTDPTAVTYTVTVTDADTSAAISGAEVKLYDRNGNVLDTKTTDADGKATWTVRKGGAYSATATKTDYTTVENLSYISPASDAVNNGTIKLAAKPTERVVDPTDPDDPDKKNYGTFNVTVTDRTTGDPIPGAKVNLYDSRGNVLDTKTTDATGKVSWTVKAGGNYAAGAQKDGFVQDGANATANNIAPNATVNGHVRMKAIAPTDPDIVVDPTQDPDTEVVNYTLRVVDGTGSPLSGANATLYDRNGRAIGSGMSNAGGVVTWIVKKNGVYSADASKSGYQAASMDTYRPNVTEDVTGTVILNKEVIVDPDVIVDPADPLAVTYTVTVTDADTGARLSDAEVKLYNRNGNVLGTETTGADGKVSWTVRKGGTYSANAAKADYVVTENRTYISPADAAANNGTIKMVSQTPERVVDPTDPDDPDKNNYGTFNVTVTDKATGNPLSGASVKLYDSKGNAIDTKTTGPDGKVSWTVKAGGSYSAGAQKDGFVQDGANAAASNIAKNTTVNGSVRMTAADPTDPDIIVDPADPDAVTYLLRVVDNNGNPVFGAPTTIYNRNGKAIGSGTSNAAGMASWTVKAGGTYSADASKNGYKVTSIDTYRPNIIQDVTGTVVLSKEVIVDPDVIVDPSDPLAVTYTVTVTDDNTGAAISGAEVKLYNRNGGVLGSKTTDAAGKASWTVRKGGTYSATATKAEYVTTENRSYISPANDTVNTGTIKMAAKTPERVVDPTDPDDPDADNYGTFAVTVTDKATGNPLADAKVNLYDSKGNVLDTKTTGADGKVSWTVKAGGSYSAGAQKDGFVQDGDNAKADNIGVNATVNGTVRMTNTTPTDPDIIVDPTDPTAVTYTLRVVDDNGNTIFDAAATLYNRNGKAIGSGTSNAAGIVSWTVKEGGTYSADASKSGYQIAGIDTYRPNATMDVTGTVILAREVITDPDVIVEPTDPTAVTYTVTVKDTANAPVSGATVNLYNRKGELLGTKTTNAQGQVSWTVKKDGTYSAAGMKDGYIADSNDTYRRNLSTSDNTPSITLKKLGTDPIGEIVDPTDPNAVKYSVKVTENTAAGSAMSGVTVYLYNSRGAYLGTAATGTDGTVSWNVKRGAGYFAIAAKDGYAQVINTTSAKVTADFTGNIALKKSATTDPDIVVPEGDSDAVKYTVYARDALGNPLPNATVFLYNRNGAVIATGNTAADGSYTWNVKKGGTYSAGGHLAGYLLVGNDTYRPAVTGSSRGTLVFKKDAGMTNTVTYTVKDKNTGAILPGAQVSLYDDKGTLIGTKTADATGKVSFEVPAGESRYATATMNGYAQNSSALTVINADTAQDILLSANAATDAKLTVYVRADSRTGALQPGATVELYSREGALLATQTADAGGSVTFNVNKNSGYSVKAYKAGIGEGQSAAFTITSSAATLTVVLTNTGGSDGELDPSGKTYTVTVTDNNGTAIPGATVKLYNGSGKLLATATADANGKASWKVKAGGNYYAEVSAAGYNSAVSEKIENLQTDTAVTVKLTASGQTGTKYPITIKVVDAANNSVLSGAEVKLYSAAGALIGTATSNGSGIASFSATLGSYYIVASRTGYITATTVSYTMTAAESTRTVTVPLAKEGTGTTYTFTGTVQNSGGTKISGASVTIYNASGTAVGTATTGTNGTFTINLPAGTYYAKITANGYNAFTSGTFTVSGSASRTFVLTASTATPTPKPTATPVPPKSDGTSPKTGEACMVHWYILAAMLLSAIYAVLRMGQKGMKWYDYAACTAVCVGALIAIINIGCVWDVLLIAAWLGAAALWVIKRKKAADFARQA